MKAYLNNGITIEGTVAEIKEFLEGQNYTITTTPNTTPILDLSFATFRP